MRPDTSSPLSKNQFLPHNDQAANSKHSFICRPANVDGEHHFYVERGTETIINRLKDGTRYIVNVIAENSRTGGVESEVKQYTSKLKKKL